MKTVALIDFAWVGHHPSYFRLFCRALLAAGCRVIAFCPQPEEVKAWEPVACQETRLDVRLLTDEVQSHRWLRKVHQWSKRYRLQQGACRMAAWEAHTGQRIDLAFFACLYDGIAPHGGADKIFPYRWTGLLLDSGGVRAADGPGKWLHYRSFDPLALFRARGCVSLATLDGFIRAELSQRTGGKVVHVLPEVVDGSPPRPDFPTAETFRAGAAGRPIIGCFGQFARRKGALGFLRLAAACQDQPWYFVWAGSPEENTFSASEWRWIKAFLAARPTNCRVEFGRVTDEADFNALIVISEVLYLCYHAHLGSSNMISKAASFGKRVLVSDGYCMADQTRHYHLGLCVPEDDTSAARAALHRLLASGGDLPPPRFAEYLQVNSLERFNGVVQEMIGG